MRMMVAYIDVLNFAELYVKIIIQCCIQMLQIFRLVGNSVHQKQGSSDLISVSSF